MEIRLKLIEEWENSLAFLIQRDQKDLMELTLVIISEAEHKISESL